jgi:hypothetical protein
LWLVYLEIESIFERERMNINMIEWLKDFIKDLEYDRATYEDVCGTGDMSDEERNELYANKDKGIDEWKHILYLLEAERDGLLLIKNI